MDQLADLLHLFRDLCAWFEVPSPRYEIVVVVFLYLYVLRAHIGLLNDHEPQQGEGYLKFREHQLRRMALTRASRCWGYLCLCGSWNWQKAYSMGQFQSTRRRLWLTALSMDQQCKTTQSHSSAFLRCFLMLLMANWWNLTVEYSCRDSSCETVRFISDSRRHFMDLQQRSSWMGQPYSLKTSQRVSTRQFMRTVLNYCQFGWIWFRRERYWPADIVEARISILEQNIRTAFTLWASRVYSYCQEICQDQITLVDYWQILPQQLLNTVMNLLRKGVRHSSKTGSSASALQYIASNFSSTFTSSKLLMQFCQFCSRTTVCCMTISLKSYLKSVSSLEVTQIIQFLVCCSGMELNISMRKRILSLRSQNRKVFSAGELRMESMSWWMCWTFLTRRQTSPLGAWGSQILREEAGCSARKRVMSRMQLLMQVDSTPNCWSSQTARYCSQRVTQFSRMRMRSLRIMYLMVYGSILETQAFISAILQLLTYSISTLLFYIEGCRQSRCT